MEEKDNQPNYCLVKYLHWECTGKHLDCKNCVINCDYKKSLGGDRSDQPTN